MPERLSATEIRGAAQQITKWIEDRGKQREEPRKGKATWQSQIALLNCLTEIELKEPGRSIKATEIRKVCPTFHRHIAVGLRQELKEFAERRIGKVLVSLPEARGSGYRLDFIDVHRRAQHTSVNASDFWRLLLALCREQRLEPTDVERDFWSRWVDNPDVKSDFHTLAGRSRSEEHPNKQRRFLDELADHKIKMSIEDMEGIGQLFNIHHLMFDPLLSTIVEEEALVIDVKGGFFSPRPAVVLTGYSYKIPDKRLAHADAALVRLNLDKRSTSDVHEHPGDELIVVLSGKIQFQLEHSGVSTILERGDYVHFWAEQRHSVIAMEDASLFIIRLYQIEAKDTRQEMRREVEDCLKENRPLSALSLAWIQQTLSSRPRKGPSHVNDKVGLARFLRRFRNYNERRNFSTLSSGCDEKQMKALEDARVETTTKSDLEQIGSCYGIREFLLQHYLYPALPNIVIVRNRIGDYDEVTDSEDTYGYRLPKRNLTGSDIAIAEVTLKPGAAIPVNDHPGFELLIPVRGSGVVLYQEDGEEREVCRFSKTAETCAHYSSERPHLVRNDSADLTTYMVIRFLRDGPPIRDLSTKSEGGVQTVPPA